MPKSVSGSEPSGPGYHDATGEPLPKRRSRRRIRRAGHGFSVAEFIGDLVGAALDAIFFS